MSSEPIRRCSSSKFRKRRSKYHRLARKSKPVLRAITEFDEDVSESDEDYLDSLLRKKKIGKCEKLMACNEARLEIFCEMARSGGDTSTPASKRAVDTLLANYNPKDFDIRRLPQRPGCKVDKNAIQLEGTWITLSKAQFKECLGVNKSNECMYTLGRLSFGK